MKKILILIIVLVFSVLLYGCESRNTIYEVRYENGYDGRVYYELVEERNDVSVEFLIEIDWIGEYYVYFDNGTPLNNFALVGELNIYYSGNTYYATKGRY